MEMAQGRSPMNAEDNSSTTEIKTVGRPEISTEEITSDATAASKDGGADTADTREFTAKEFDGHCLICGRASDLKICTDCAEAYDLEVEE